MTSKAEKMLQETVIPLQLRGRGFLWDWSTVRVEQQGPRSCFLVLSNKEFLGTKEQNKDPGKHLGMTVMLTVRTQQTARALFRFC